MSLTSVPTGILAAAGSALDGVMETIHTRLRLLSLELQEEKLRLVQLAFWIAAAVFCGGMVMTFLSAIIVYVFWDRAPLEALVGLAAFYVVSFAVILRQFRRFLGRQPTPFDSTLHELQKDRACIRPLS